jgi:isopentenyl-diphosphate delta-isomerase
MPEEVVLVDLDDRVVGTMEKYAAHARGVLHRALSIFVIRPNGDILLQKRALGKYHSGGLWTNTCCSHPRPGEDPSEAAHRRLREEMGFDCALRTAFTFVYDTDVGGGLREHELVQVHVGAYAADPVPEPSEVGDWRWSSYEAIRAEAKASPAKFTVWFRILLEHPMLRESLHGDSRSGTGGS